MNCTLFYCKCEKCRQTVGLSWFKPELEERSEFLKKLLDKATETCGFCAEPCGNEWCCMKEG